MRVGGLEARQEVVDGGGGEIATGHADGGEGWDGVFGEVDVVETDEGEVVGDAEVGFEERVLNTDGGHVVGTHDGGWPVGHREDLLHRVVAAIERVIAFDEPVWVGLEAGGLKATEEGGLAALSRAAGEGAADEADVAMAKNGEMLHAFVDAGAVVDGKEGVDGAGGRGIDEDVGDVF